MAGKRTRWTAFTIFVTVLASFLPSGSLWLFERTLANAPVFSFPDCSKVWAHRGYAGVERENTLASVQAGFDLGAAGVEVDVLYDRKRGNFVVAHDETDPRIEGQPLLLSSLFEHNRARGFLWLDAKNLRKLSPWTAHEATRRLSRLIEQYDLTHRVIVESGNPLYLSWLARRGVYTSYMVSPNERRYGRFTLRFIAAIDRLGYAMIGGGAISMDASRYTQAVASEFAQAPILLSTVNDKSELRRLSSNVSVKVILTDEQHFAIHACPSNAVSD